MWVKMTEELVGGRRDNVLDMPLLHQTERTMVVGLAGIGGERLYMLPVDDSRLLQEGRLVRTEDYTTLLHCDWDLELL